jgi:hypothetical protein
VEIVSLERFDRSELLARIRRTPLRGFGGARPYATADVALEAALDPERLVPTQRYVLAPNVDRILELRSALLPYGLDVFALDGGAYVRTREAEQPVPVIPPVVEESRDARGREVLLVNDGLHRVFAARSIGSPITAVVVRDVPAEYPYYAFPLESGWSEVARLDELPDGFEKKAYRNPDNYKALFREFNEVFPGVQEQRKPSNPAHLSA